MQVNLCRKKGAYNTYCQAGSRILVTLFYSEHENVNWEAVTFNESESMRKIIVDNIVKVYAFLSAPIPEGSLKQKIRLFIFKFKPYLHKEFLINKGETVFLIGSPSAQNIENTLRVVGRKGRVVLVEADQENVRKLSSYFGEHPKHNLTIIPKAAFSRQGKGLFCIAPNPLDHKLLIDNIDMDNDYQADDYYLETIEMDVDTVDNIAEELGIQSIDYIEITVNGAEVHVLEGMEKMLNKTNRVFAKGHAKNKETGAPIHKEIEPLLKSYGFQTFLTKPTKSFARTVEWGLRLGDVFAWK